jgi:polysaccharide export outer membrane protein
MRFFLLWTICLSCLLPCRVMSADQYHVGKGDVLAIKVYENDDLSATVRVSENDTIRVPLIGEITVWNMTVSEVSQEIEKRLADGYLVNPQVDVFINEYRSKKAVILGEISSPGIYELRGRTTFLEFLSKAGGLKQDAGTTATIKRRTSVEGANEQIVIDLNLLIRKGDTSQNILINDGDSVYISKSDIFYVSGEVEKPDSYKLDAELTVIQAITKAGGFTKIAAKNKVRIIRVIEGKNQVVENAKMDEKVLHNDVIVVPESFF